MCCINACRPILHKYANEDVSLGAWFIGLDVEHIDERNMCCETPPGFVSFLVTKIKDFENSILFNYWSLAFLQTVSGKLRLEMYALHHLTGVAVGYANQ